MPISSFKLHQLEKENAFITIAEGLTVIKGQVLAATENDYILADCSSLDSIQGTVIAVDDQLNHEVRIITSGIQELPGGIQGKNVYIGHAGEVTTVVPAGVGEWVKCIGTVINSSQWRFEPDAFAVMNSDNIETWAETVLSEKITIANQGLDELNGTINHVRTDILALDDEIAELHGTLISDPILKAAVVSLETRVADVETSKIAASEKGVINGVATLDSTGIIPSAQLPSYVDDVVEFNYFTSLPAIGEKSKIYVTTANDNKIWRWTGTAYIEVSPTAGNADTATKLAAARTISINGDLTGSASFDGSNNVIIQTTLANDIYTKAEVDTMVGNIDSILTALGV